MASVFQTDKWSSFQRAAGNLRGPGYGGETRNRKNARFTVSTRTWRLPERKPGQIYLKLMK